MRHLFTKWGRLQARGRDTNGKRHASHLETLEARQLLSVAPVEYDGILNAYPELELPAMVANAVPSQQDLNMIEIDSAELSYESIRNAVDLAATTPQNDLIVLRVSEVNSQINLGDSSLTIDIDPNLAGSVTIVSLGLTMPEFVTSSPDGAIYVEDGDVQLGGIAMIGAQGANGQTPSGWQLLQTSDEASLTTSRIVFLNRTGGEASGSTFKTNETGLFDAAILTSSDADPFYTTGLVIAEGTTDWPTGSATNAFPVDTDNYAAEFQLTGTTWAYLTGLSAEEVATIEAGTFDVNDIDPYDAEKDGVADTELCWAATTSNMLRYTQWGMVNGMETEDDLLDYFTECFTDFGSRVEYGINWFMTGYYKAQNWSGWAQVKSDKLDEGALWPQIEDTLDNYTDCIKFDVDGLTQIDTQLRQNSAIGIALGWMDNSMTRYGGHAITMWGYVYDSSLAVTDPTRYTGLFVTDSDSYEGGMGRDADNVLHQYGITWDTDNSQYYFDVYGNSDTYTGYLEDLTWLTQLPEELYYRSQLVTTLEDVVDANDGVLSLREAVQLAQSQELDSIIQFASNLRGGTIELNGNPIVFSGNITIDGSDLSFSSAGTPGITIDANGQSRIFEVQSGAVVSVANVALVGGRSVVDAGGAILNHGTLLLTNTTISGSEAVSGGGIRSDGTLMLTNSTVSGNRAIGTGGGIYSSGTTVVNNSIVALNVGGDLSDAAGTTSTTNSSLIGGDPKYVKTPSVIDATTTGVRYNSDNWDLRPRGDSPAMNAGNNLLAVDSDGAPLQTDLSGRERVLENTVEIGAYEGSFDLETTSGGTLVESGSTFTITTAEIQNISVTDVGSYSIKFYASKDSTVTKEDTLLYTRSMAGLSAGDLTTLTQTLKTSKLAIGEWYIGWIVVADGEVNTANNVGVCSETLTIEATISTDILANDGGLLSSAQIVEGNNVTVTTGPIQNLGNVESGTWSIHFYALTELELEDGGIASGLGTPLWTIDGMESLAATSRTIVTATVDTTTLAPGTYTIGWIVPGLSGEWTADNNVGYCTTQLVVLSKTETPNTVVTTSEDIVDDMDGLISLREAIKYAGTFGLGSEITFDRSLEGKTIRLSSEDGFGQLIVDKSLTIDAMSLWNANAGTPGLTIDAGRVESDAQGRVLSIYNADETLDVTLKGMTITGGKVTPSSVNRLEGNGGGISINGENVTLQDVVVTGNQAGLGGGIFSQSGTLNVEDCVIDGNVATIHGGGIYHDSGELTITNSTLSHNQATAWGGAIYSGNELLQVTSAKIFGNEAGRGGGLYSVGMGQDASGIANSLISGNIATSLGAGIFASEDRLTISNCTVAGNVSDQDGSGLYSDGSRLVINNTIVANNPAGVGGFDIRSDSLSEISGDYNVLGTEFVFKDGVRHNQFGDPAFVEIPWTIDATVVGLNYDATEWNLSLQSSSLAVNTGSNVRAVDAEKHPLTADLVGNSRYYGFDGVVDVGAYEYQGAKTRFPTTPVNVEARATGISEILLSWRESPEAVSYVVQRSADGESGWVTLGTTYTERYMDSGLTANTGYFYRVIAENSFGTSQPSSVVGLVTPIMDLETVSGGTLVSESVLSEDTFVIPYGATFTITTGSIQNIGSVASGAFNVNFYASHDGTLTSSDIWLGSVAMDSLAVGASTTASILLDTKWSAENAEYTMGWIVSGTTPEARIDNNVATVPQTLTVISKIPGEPVGVVASVGTKSEITVGWNRVLGAVDYIVERSLDGMSGWVQVGSTEQTNYTDSDLPLDTTFYYRVLARNAEGTSYVSEVVNATTPENVVIDVPATPTNVDVVALSDTEIQVRWDSVVDATEYQVLRSLDGGTSWIELGMVSVNEFVDTGLTAEVMYYYRVKAVNTEGSSAASKAVHATTLQKPEQELPSGGLKQPSRAFSVTEGAKLNTSVGSVAAVRSAARGDVYLFKLTEGSEYFTINAKTGKITTIAQIDFETTPTIDIVVETSVNGTPTWADSFTVQVKNVDEVPVDVGIVGENGVLNTVKFEEGTFVVGTLTATDPEGNAIVGYKLSGNDAKLFEVVKVGDQFELRAKSPLVFEAPCSKSGTNTYAIELIPSDGGRKTSKTPLAIEVTNKVYAEGEVVTIANTAGGTWVLEQKGDKIQIISGRTVVFSESVSTLPALKIAGSEKKDTLTWNLDGWDTTAQMAITFDGADGADWVKIVGSSEAENFLFTEEGVQVGETTLVLGRVIEADAELGIKASFEANIEALSVEGGEGNDTYRFTGLNTTTTITDKKGIDTFDLSEAKEGVTLDLNTTRAQNVFGQSLTVKNSPEILIGSDFDDTLTGARSGCLIDGGIGQDTLAASGGRNVLIGGAAADVIFGGGGEDLLIGGTCSMSLEELYLNWCAAKGTFNARTATLSGLRSSVADDDATDRIHGGMGQDWFFGTEDEFLDFDETSRAKDQAN